MSFMQDLLSNSSNYSFGRFMSLVLSVFVLGWDTAALVFAWKINLLHLPGVTFVSLLPDPFTLGAQGIFVLLFYGTTKTGDILGAKIPPASPIPPAPQA